MGYAVKLGNSKEQTTIVNFSRNNSSLPYNTWGALPEIKITPKIMLYIAPSTYNFPVLFEIIDKSISRVNGSSYWSANISNNTF